MGARPRILAIQNADWEGTGLFGLGARAAGFSLRTVRLFRGPRGPHAIPFEELEKGSYAAVVCLGSPSTAYLPETNPHHEELVELFRLVRARSIPSFDICYSMQLFSIVHGGKAAKNPAGKEVGFYDVRLTPEGRSDRVFGPAGTHSALQWHGDVVEELPPGAIRIGYSEKTTNQLAVLDGIHYLVQGDGQAASPSMVRSWLKHDGRWALSGTMVDKDDLLRRAVEEEAHHREAYSGIVRRFLALAASHQALRSD